jgi:hypothetical protein
MYTNNGGYNNGRGYNRNYNNNGGGNGNYNRGGNGGNAGRPNKKHSGARVTVIKQGKNQGQWCITAWNVSRDKGMVSVLIVPYGKTHESKSKGGRLWLNMMAKVTFKRYGETKLFSAMVDSSTKKATIEELGWTINPSAPNGGYCGKWASKRR